MFDRLLAFLKSVPEGGNKDVYDRNDPRVATAALLFHVMDADGVRRESEMDTIRNALAEAYGLTDAKLEELVAAGEKADSEAIDLYGFTSVLARELDHPSRIDLIGLMWEIVFADGVMHELEDSVVWRVAELLHVERRDRIEMRQRAEARRAGGGEE